VTSRFLVTPLDAYVDFCVRLERGRTAPTVGTTLTAPSTRWLSSHAEHGAPPWVALRGPGQPGRHGRVRTRAVPGRFSASSRRRCRSHPCGCNTRYEVLIRDAARSPHIGAGCRLTHGRWKSPYDRVVTTNPNDLGTKFDLLAVAHSNESKGDRGPDQWLPAKGSFNCRYEADYTAVPWRWHLTMTDPRSGSSRNNSKLAGSRPFFALAELRSIAARTRHRRTEARAAGTTHSCVHHDVERRPYQTRRILPPS
jgi:hypothetical protein